jgi:hypothetical protein
MMKKPFNKTFKKADIHLKNKRHNTKHVFVFSIMHSFFSTRKETPTKERGESKEWP